jgi:hypothetical protein
MKRHPASGIRHPEDLAPNNGSFSALGNAFPVTKRSTATICDPHHN